MQHKGCECLMSQFNGLYFGLGQAFAQKPSYQQLPASGEDNVCMQVPGRQYHLSA